MDPQFERLDGGFLVAVDAAHRFAADAFLLEDFSRARKNDTVLDLCAGTGIVGLLMLRREDAPRRVTAMDLDAGAVALMNASARVNRLTGRFRPVRGDLRRPCDLPPVPRFSLVTANPPYFAAGSGAPSSDESRRNARHESAGSCTFHEVAEAAARVLRHGGRFCCCRRPEGLADSFAALRACGLEPKRLRFAAHRPGSAPWLALLEGRKGGKPGLLVMPSLFSGKKTAPSPEG